MSQKIYFATNDGADLQLYMEHMEIASTLDEVIKKAKDDAFKRHTSNDNDFTCFYGVDKKSFSTEYEPLEKKDGAQIGVLHIKFTAEGEFADPVNFYPNTEKRIKYDVLVFEREF